MKRHNISSLRHEISRQRRNNILLLLIVSLYAISWLPFNISYILFTYADRLRVSGELERVSVRHSSMGSFLSLVQSRSNENVNGLAIYLPLRFLLCMISAISNPFLYSYFNETFKEGLTRLLSSCSPRIHRRNVNRVSFHQNQPISLSTKKTENNLSSAH